MKMTGEIITVEKLALLKPFIPINLKISGTEMKMKLGKPHHVIYNVVINNKLKMTKTTILTKITKKLLSAKA